MDLKISTGIKEYDILGKVKVYFNPTDPFFLERLADAIDFCDVKSDERKKRITGVTDGREVFKAAREFDAEVREAINNVFETDVCTPAFGNISLLAQSEGLPLWANLLLAAWDEADDTFTAEKAATNPRIAKYTEKYKKYDKN